jgi:hypothetical protein
MNSITVEGVTLHYAPTIHNEGFDCKDCALKHSEHGCVRIRRDGELYFETRIIEDGKLFCISAQRDVVFINNTPEDIARYVAARLEAA